MAGFAVVEIYTQKMVEPRDGEADFVPGVFDNFSDLLAKFW